MESHPSGEFLPKRISRTSVARTLLHRIARDYTMGPAQKRLELLALRAQAEPRTQSHLRSFVPQKTGKLAQKSVHTQAAGITQKRLEPYFLFLLRNATSTARVLRFGSTLSCFSVNCNTICQRRALALLKAARCSSVLTCPNKHVQHGIIRGTL